MGSDTQAPEQRRVGRFVLGDRIASGGMATVFAAHAEMPSDPLAGRELAIKILHEHLAEDDDFIRMFRDEGRLASRLEHPNIVRVHEVGEHEGTHFLVMDRINGRNLAHVLESLGAVRKQVDRAQAFAILRANLQALVYVHELQGRDGRSLGLVHRDISPHNILISDDERVLLTDFGIARGEHRSDRTRTGTIKGKLHYMAPEQARGARVDARSDLYSLGVVAYELFTNRVLLGSEATFALQQRVATGRIELDADAMKKLPADLAAWLARALDPERDARFQSAAEMLQALDSTRAASNARLKVGALRRLIDQALAHEAARAKVPQPQLLFAESDLETPRKSEPSVPLPEGMVLTPQRPISGVFARQSEVKRRVDRAKALPKVQAEPAAASESDADVVPLRPRRRGSAVARNSVRDAEAAARRASRSAVPRVADHDADAVEKSRVIALQAAGVAPDDPDIRPATAAEVESDPAQHAKITQLRVEKERRIAVAGIVAWSCVAMLLFSTLLEVWDARLELPQVDEQSFVELREGLVQRVLGVGATQAPDRAAGPETASVERGPDGHADARLGTAASKPHPRLRELPAPVEVRNDRFLPRGVDPPAGAAPPAR